MVGNGSRFIAHGGGASVLGDGFREGSETVEDGAGEEARCTMTMVDRLQCGVRGRR